jgi:lysophospholipase L1-like esterase
MGERHHTEEHAMSAPDLHNADRLDSHRTRRRGRTIGVRAMLMTALALSIVALGHAAVGRAAATPLTVVAAGDSYASGEGAIGAGWLNVACHRSALAGPQDASVRLSALRPTSFTSFACSGATTSGVLGQLGALPGGPIDALTISMGGNDIGFAGIVTSCVVTPPLILPDCTAADAGVTTSLTTLSTSLAGVFASVPARVANVFVTEYPDPTTGVFGALCGTAPSPAFQGLEGITAVEAGWASTRVVGRLNATLSAAVAAANALPGPHPVFHFVTGISARFATHGYCTGGGSPVPWAWFNPRFVGTPIDSLTSQGDIRGTMHPNDLGQMAIGEALAAAMDFLTRPMRVRVSSSATPIIGSPAALTVDVSTSAGTPVPGAPVLVDGTFAGTTDQTGKVAFTRTFSSTGLHTASVDHNPYPAASATFTVYGKSYTVTSTPTPIPVDTAITLSLQANDQSGQLVAGTFTLTSGTGTTSIRSGTSAAVTLGMRFIYQWEEGPTGKPVRVRVPICPELMFRPDSAAFDPRDVSSLVRCVSAA